MSTQCSAHAICYGRQSRRAEHDVNNDYNKIMTSSLTHFVPVTFDHDTTVVIVLFFSLNSKT